jgi:hypothetical protein
VANKLLWIKSTTLFRYMLQIYFFSVWILFMTHFPLEDKSVINCFGLMSFFVFFFLLFFY